MNLQAEIEDLTVLKEEMQRISRAARTIEGRVLYYNRAEFYNDLVKRFQELTLKERLKNEKNKISRS